MKKYLKLLDPLALLMMFTLVVGTYYVTINLNPMTATPIQKASVLGTQAYPMTLSEISTAKYNEVKESFLTYNYDTSTYAYKLKLKKLSTGDLSLPIMQIKHNGFSEKQSFVVSPTVSPQVQGLEMYLYIDGEKYNLYTPIGTLLSPTVFIPKGNITTVELHLNSHNQIFFPLELKLNWQ